METIEGIVKVRDAHFHKCLLPQSSSQAQPRPVRERRRVSCPLVGGGEVAVAGESSVLLPLDTLTLLEAVSLENWPSVCRLGKRQMGVAPE